MSKPSNILIVGAGHAGGRAAEHLRKLGYDGRLTLLGMEPDLPYERPPLSKGYLTGEKDFDFCLLKDEAFYQENAIELIRSTAAVTMDAADKTVYLTSRQSLSYDHLIFATGAAPRRLPLPGLDLEGVFLLRDREDSDAIGAALRAGKRTVIVGGGFIGLEVAASARQLGSEVVVLEAADRLLGRALPQDAGDAMAEIHRAKGTEIHLNAAIKGFLGEGRVSAVELADGTRIEADSVILGVGITPVVELATIAGLPAPNGVLTDARCATEAPGIFAIGDAACSLNPQYGKAIRLESWQNAEQQAEVAAKAILGQGEDHAPVPWVWSDQYDWNIQMAGFPAEGDQVVVRGSVEGGKLLLLSLAQGALIGAAGLGVGTAAAKDLRFAQKLIEKGARPDAQALADPDTPIKSFLKAA